MTTKAKGKSDPSKTLSVPEAGKKYFNLAPNAAYEAARRGEIPVIKIGGRIRAVVPAIERMLAAAGPEIGDRPTKLIPDKADTAA